jgi:hypothetical protein
MLIKWLPLSQKKPLAAFSGGFNGADGNVRSQQGHQPVGLNRSSSLYSGPNIVNSHLNSNLFRSAHLLAFPLKPPTSQQVPEKNPASCRIRISRPKGR